MKIHLIDVGRGHFNGVINIPDKLLDRLGPNDIAAIVLREARKHLISVNVEVFVDLEKCEGTIFAGFHSVGKIKIEK